jgi:hypothetical protein
MIERIRYRGWDNCCKLSNGTVELVVLANVGPRIIFYGFYGGENQFHEVEEDAGQTGTTKFRLYGGHRLWVSPEVKSTYFPDNSPVTISEHGNAICFTAPSEDTPPGTSLQKELEIEFAPTASGVRVTHRITNHSSNPTLVAPWAPTMMRAGGRAILPLPPRHTMDESHYQSVGVFGVWSFTDFADSRWQLGTEFIQLSQSANPTGRFREQMGGIFNPAGWGAYFRQGKLFVKCMPVIEGASYPDSGCNFQLFTNPEFLELETLGPIVELAPGATVEHVERWWLFADVPDGDNEDWIRKVVAPRAAQTHS